VSESFCGSTSKPTASMACDAGACPPGVTFSWALGAWSGCSATCGYGTQYRSVQCKGSDGSSGLETACITVKPSSSQVFQALMIARLQLMILCSSCHYLLIPIYDMYTTLAINRSSIDLLRRLLPQLLLEDRIVGLVLRHVWLRHAEPIGHVRCRRLDRRGLRLELRVCRAQTVHFSNMQSEPVHLNSSTHRWRWCR